MLYCIGVSVADNINGVNTLDVYHIHKNPDMFYLSLYEFVVVNILPHIARTTQNNIFQL